MTVKVYSTPNCAQCKMTYKELDKRAIPYEVIDLSQDNDARDMVMGRLGYRQAPVVIVSESDHWAGFRPDLISKIEAAA